MPIKQSKDAPKRLNRTVPLGDAMGRLLEPAFRKRGFASRDIVTHWPSIAPSPYDRVAMPDRLAWPRGEKRAEGATLYLRALPGHGTAIAHDGPRIAASVNRYFGYVLVAQVRLSAEPFTPHSAAKAQSVDEIDASQRRHIEDSVQDVEDEGLREALKGLGEALMKRRRK
ncbi:DUF721 domain-containing protein [Arsenicitalea aurantiaca]|uniref:DUF721 domain-containing protein n=1 Tax=Arsenicitalea aurantiaca TaxID=1783274 RepID=A0A433XAQ8_9HYPH|nr:DciA family protein [Arsenicitalea aurantiaca]RUT31155.1 DUF721 domain-containing protein [Arsenicitalea aurantiaca]